MQHVELRNETVTEAEHYVKMVAMGKILGVTLVGPPGLGKTHLVEHVLDEMGIEYEKYGGHITLAAIYEYLFENHDKLIFFDDCSQLVRHTEIMELLKQALSESQMKRELNYRSKGTRIEAPKKFTFKGKIIMAFNKFDKNDENVKAILSRAPVIQLKYSRQEVIDAYYKIAKGDAGDLLEHEKVIITREIETYTDNMMELNLRQQQQAFKIYASCKELYGNPPPSDKWKPLIRRLFGKKRESWIRDMIRDAVGEGKLKRKELARMIALRMNMSPRNAQRRIAEWIEAGEIYQDKLRDGDVSVNPFHKGC